MFKHLILPLLFICILPAYGQNNDVFCEQLNALKNLVQSDHYAPKAINDSLSIGVYNLFLEQIDEDHRYYLTSDLEVFSKDSLLIDDYILKQDCAFINKYATVLKDRLINTKSIIQTLITEPFDYSGKDTLYFITSSKQKNFKDEATLKKYWNKRIRYDILTELIDQDSIYDTIELNFTTLEQALKPKIIQNQLCLIDELINKNGGLETYVKELFLNAYMKYHDPNSSFFNNSDKTIFESTVANSQLTFGIFTDKNDDGDIYISYITPGSVAFQEGTIEVNDILKSLTSEEDVLEAFCISNDDVIAFTNDDNHHTINFKVKKQNGAVVDIQLTKAEAKVEENAIRGYIINSNSKVGYINIPSFYTNFESANGLGLANDIAKELYKFQKEDIEGLILDLRFNGGGSMKEAADLIGMFINKGPISILRYNNDDLYTVKDDNRGSLYKKPLVVLINHFSASASEFFAGVLQDYNRAVIVGTTSHGKSTVQVILPLDETNESLGFSKLTVEKFYRVTGKSHQSVGVIPDIQLPSLYDNFKTDERFEQYALSNDTVPVFIKHYPLEKLPIKALQKQSQKRIQKHPVFNTIKTTNQNMVNEYLFSDTQYPLTLKNVYSEIDTYNSLWTDFYEQSSNYSTQLSITNTSYVNELLKNNEAETKANQQQLEDLKSDVYIEEAYAIINQLIHNKPKS